MDYIKENKLDAINYPFVKKYGELKIRAYFDKINKMYWVNHCGYKLYISRAYKTEEEAVRYYKDILLEQDEKSPHRYLDENFRINKGDVVVDAGAAEGCFSLEIIEDASKIYILETDADWIDALKLTFADYMDKIVLIKGFVSSYNDGTQITLDSVIHEPINFIKMDLEGNEWDALQGARHLLSISDRVQLAVCAYHRDFDQDLIESFMEKLQIEHSVTKGYMWFPYICMGNYVSAKLNRAIVRGRKRKDERQNGFNQVGKEDNR